MAPADPTSTISHAVAARLADPAAKQPFVASALEIIEARNDTIRAYLQIVSRSQLRRSAATSAQGSGVLAGVPICVKDVIDVGGMRTTAGSAAWSRFARRDATVVLRLHRDGAVVLGKGNTNEFAYGVDGTNPHVGDCSNPLDVERMSGGSSSGPAAAVAAGMALGGVGTDTSGSVRVPAALCGLVGLRTTFGAVPMAGIVPLAPSYDAVGLLARTVEDVWLLWDTMSAATARRAGSLRPAGVRGMRVSVIDELFTLADPAVGAGLELALRRLERRGVKLTSARLGNQADAGRVHTTILQYEAARVHSRWPVAQRRRYGRPLRDLLALGQQVSRREYDSARSLRRKLAANLDAARAGADALAAPTTPIVAPARAVVTRPAQGDARARLRDRLLSCTVPLTQAPGPVLSVPTGDDCGLPYGLQFAGVREGTEASLLRLGGACERPWSRT